MFKLSISGVFKLIFFLLIFNFTALANNFLVDKNNKLFIETSNSGFKFHKNYMSQNKYNFSYIEDNLKSRSGNYYQRFELRNGDCFGDENWSDCDNDRQRIELSSKPNQPISGKQCYGYSIKLSNSFTDIRKVSTTLGQIHQKGGPSGKANSLSSFPPLIQIDARKGKLYLNWHKLSGSSKNVKDESKYYKLKTLKSMKGVWTDISICLDFKNKRIDAWVDGDNVVKILKSPIFFEPDSIYFKHGIYQSFISNYTSFKGETPTQIVYYDEVRRGNSIEEVDKNINPDLKFVD
tara:strand:+ start:3196 stop:4071 length:876 start_codon:yes stop_codon:yes gene_type:complete